MRALILLFSTGLQNNIWEEAIFNADWILNRLPSTSFYGYVPMSGWDPRCEIYFASFLIFGQPCFAFIYQLSITARDKLLSRSSLAKLLTMRSDTRIILVYIPEKKVIRIVFQEYFHPILDDSLPSVSSILDFL